MQLGGWYKNPATGKNQRYWGSYGWTDGSDPTGGGTKVATPQNTADSYYNDLSKSVNSYVDQLISEAGGQRDLAIKKLDAQHKLALGNDDVNGAQFLESVADGLEQKIGRIPYDYQRYSKRELDQYSQDTKDIKTNKDLALEKLNNDEKQLSQNQDVTNRATTEDLNSKGLLDGQTPKLDQTSMGNDPLSGLTGIAGKRASVVNNQFSGNFEDLATSKAGTLASFDSQQANRDLQHGNTMQDITTDARRGAEDINLNTGIGKDSANLSYQQQMAALQRQRDALLQNARTGSATLAGKQNGILGY